MDNHQRSHQDELATQRKRAAANHEEYLVPLEFPVQWDTGDPSPQLLLNDRRCFLSFYVQEQDVDFISSRVAVVEFSHCIATKMGTPNDEVQHGHPLAGKGLELYAAQEIVNSHWLAECEAINSVHRSFVPEKWKNLHHYVMWFHDSTFECIAKSFEVEVHEMSLADVLKEIANSLLC